MKTKITFKNLLIITNLLLQFNLHAQSSSYNREINQQSQAFDKCKHYADQKYYELAIDCWEKLVTVDAGRAYYNIGTTYGLLGKDNLAIFYLQKAINIDPDFRDAYYNIGMTYEYQEKYSEAIRFYKEALTKSNSVGISIAQICFSIANCYNNIGYYHYLNQNYNQVQENYNQAIIYRHKGILLEPNDSEEYLKLGRVYWAVGNTAQAIKYLEIAERLGNNEAKQLLKDIIRRP